jgi:hypothetical protein
LIELGLPKRPVPYWRVRLPKKGILAGKEYRPHDTGNFELESGNRRT